MIRELDVVALTSDLPEHGLKAGDVGTVAMVHAGGAGFEVEFATFTGETLAVVTLPPTAVRRLRQREIAHVREVV